MPEDKLILTFVPSLVSLLLASEERKGAPLAQQEVLEIRDKATVEALPEFLITRGTIFNSQDNHVCLLLSGAA